MTYKRPWWHWLLLFMGVDIHPPEPPPTPEPKPRTEFDKYQDDMLISRWNIENRN